MLAGGDVCMGRWFPGFSRCSGWDLSDCLNTGPTVMHCSGAAGHWAEQTASFTSTASGEAQLGSSAWLWLKTRSPAFFPAPLLVSIIVTSSLGGAVPKPGETERQREGKRKEGQKERPEQLVHPGLCRLPAGDSQREWGMCALLCQDFMSYTWRAMWKCFLCTVCIMLFSFFHPFFFFSLLPSLFHTVFLSTVAFKSSKFAFLFSDKVFPGC